MEALKELIIKKISELVPSASPDDAQLLDVLNRLLGTVSAALIAAKHEDA